VNDELGSMWKEAVTSQFKVLSWHLPGGTEGKKMKNLSQDSRSLGRYSNPGSPKYETGVLTTKP
jgi:hypothetical protein